MAVKDIESMMTDELTQQMNDARRLAGDLCRYAVDANTFRTMFESLNEKLTAVVDGLSEAVGDRKTAAEYVLVKMDVWNDADCLRNAV